MIKHKLRRCKRCTVTFREVPTIDRKICPKCEHESMKNAMALLNSIIPVLYEYQEKEIDASKANNVRYLANKALIIIKSAKETTLYLETHGEPTN
jgi:anaerobic ribonucleoside-triphosphate reductase